MGDAGPTLPLDDGTTPTGTGIPQGGPVDVVPAQFGPRAEQVAMPQMLALVQAQLHQHNMLLPPPEILERYEALIPGSAARLMAQVEKQGEHRRALETTAVNAGHRNQLAGTIAGGVVCSGVLVVAALAAVNGQALAAVLMVALVIVALAGVFVTGKVGKEGEMNRKFEAMLDHLPLPIGGRKPPEGQANRPSAH